MFLFIYLNLFEQAIFFIKKGSNGFNNILGLIEHFLDLLQRFFLIPGTRQVPFHP